MAHEIAAKATKKRIKAIVYFFAWTTAATAITMRIRPAEAVAIVGIVIPKYMVGIKR